MILAVETSSTACSVALQPEKEPTHIIHRWVEGRQEHSKQLLPFIQQCLEEASGSFEQGMLNLEQVIIGNGPGSYTGLRIAGSALRGLLFRRSIPVKVVSTLSMLAASVIATEGIQEVSKRTLIPELKDVLLKAHTSKFEIQAIIDARGGYYYHRAFHCSNYSIVPTTEARRVHSEELYDAWERQSRKLLIGSGAEHFRDQLSAHGNYIWQDLPAQFHASNLLKVWHLDMPDSMEDHAIEHLEPYYLGNNQVNNTRISS